MKARFSIPKPPGIVVAMLCLINSPAFSQEAMAYNRVGTNFFQRNPTAVNNLSLGDLLTNIEKRHDVSFVCRSEVLDIKVNAGKEDFSQIPYAKIRMYEGTPTKVVSEFASYNVSADRQYVNKRSIIMGKLYKRNGEWKFSAIGDPTDDTFLGQTIHKIVQSYL